MTIAQEIAKQVGNKALYMLGAKDLIGLDNGLQFKIRGSRTVNTIRITLNGLDLYNVEFMKVTNYGMNVNAVEQRENVYFDGVRSAIEDVTGLYTSI